ncbi:COG4223 family protein [Actibacterium sp. D379-3]
MTNSSKTTETETSDTAPEAEDQTPEAVLGAEIPDETSEAEDAADLPEEEPQVAEPSFEEIPEPEPIPASAPKRRGGFLGMFAGTLTGGILAAVLGFAAAQYLGPDAWPFGKSKGEETAALIAAQNQQIDTLTMQLTELKGIVAARAEVDVTPQLNALQDSVTAEIGAVSGQIDSVAADLQAVDTRLTEIEKRPIAAGADISGAVAAYEKELDAMRNELAAQRAHNDELGAKVAAAADAATAEIAAAATHAKQLEARAAMMRIMAALEAGGGFASALDSLGDAEVPAALVENAQTGVPTLTMLQAAFTDPARAALAASLRARAGDNAGDRMSAFLRTQIGARSLTPREGDDPDAILSRAEAAVQAGDLDAALTEIAALPDAGQAEMADWVAQARTRLDALAAADTLAASLTLN